MIKSAQMIQLVKLSSDVVPPVLSCVTGPTCWPPRDDPSPVGIHFNRQTMINELKMSEKIFLKNLKQSVERNFGTGQTLYSHLISVTENTLFLPYIKLI